jgi:hypothetical protein
VSDQWNTVFDDFQGVKRKLLTRGRPGVETLPADPPAELISDYQTANHVVEQLAERGVHLHFETETDSDRVYVQVLNENGHVIADISPLKLLDALADDCDLLDTR